MIVRKRSVRLGIGVGGFGALAHVLTLSVLVALPQRILGEQATNAFLTTWFGPISTLGRGLTFYGTPLLAAIVGYYLVTRKGVPVEEVAVGFVGGGAAFGVGVALSNWAVTAPAFRVSAAEYALQSARFAARVVGPALVGALGGRVLGDRLVPAPK